MARETQKEIIPISKEEEEEAAAKVEIWQYILGFTATAVVKCAIELGIADVLENRDTPIALSELSSELQCSPSSLYRIMRFLIHRKIFKEKPICPESSLSGYVQTPLSRLLTRQGSHSVADFLLMESSPAMLAPWHHLSSWVKSGTLAFDSAHGADLWGFCNANPEHNKLFNDGMGCDARNAVGAVVEGWPEVFEGLSSMVDVGGGDGTAIGRIVEACPWIKGINFDLPHVVKVAPKINGVEHVGGDMFNHVPKADAVFIMKVLHDWNDEKCIDILRKCGCAISHKIGKVIIVDAVIDDKEESKYDDVKLLLDMVMIAHTTEGKERTPNEWAHVLHKAGFTKHTIKHIPAYQSVIEAYP